MMGRGGHGISILILSLRDKNGTRSSLVESVWTISMPHADVESIQQLSRPGFLRLVFLQA